MQQDFPQYNYLHPQPTVYQPLHLNKPVRQQLPAMVLQKPRNTRDPYTLRQYDLPSPRNNRRRQRNHLRRKGKDQFAPRIESQPSISVPKKPRLQEKKCERSPKKNQNTVLSISQSNHKTNSIEGGPNCNDVVCYSILSPRRRKRVVAVQPNSTHEGNLRFCNLVRSLSHSYKRTMDSKSSKEQEQKKLAQSVADKIRSRGGRFLVWIKQNENLTHHTNNGSWQLVGKEDVLNISRYALLKKANALEVPERRTKVDVHKKIDSSEHTTAINAEELASSTILNILSGLNVDSDEDDLDIWSSSPGKSDESKDRKQTEAARLEARCWEYKLLLPL